MAAKSKMKILQYLVGLIVVAAIIAGVFLINFKKEKPEEPMVARPLKMFTVGDLAGISSREYPGKVTVKDKADLSFQVGGQVIDFPTLKGQRIKKGDILAKLDDRDYKNRYNSAKASYNQKKIYLQRIEKAVASGAVSKTDLTNAQSAYEQAFANLEIAKKNLQDTILRAPYDAIVSDTYIQCFEMVAPNKPILGIQDIHYIQVEAYVPQERILEANKTRGDFSYSVTFDSLPGVKFDVSLREFTTKADPKTQTYTITFTMPMQDKYTILPGMTATLTETPIASKLKKTDNLIAPIDTVPIDGQGQYYVWKVQKTGKTFVVHRQDVTVGKAIGDNIEILNGLEKGDRIASHGVSLLREGQPVREYKLNSNQ